MATLKAGFIDSGKNPPPTRRRRQDDGSIAVEKLPAMPFRTYLDLEGNSRNFPMTNGVNNRDPDDKSGRDKSRRVEAAGMVPYFECPLARQDLAWTVPDDIRKKVCMPETYGARKGPHGTVCSHVKEMQKRRQSAHRVKHEEHAARAKSADQKRLELAIEEKAERSAEMKEANELKRQEIELTKMQLELAKIQAGISTSSVKENATAKPK